VSAFSCIGKNETVFLISRRERKSHVYKCNLYRETLGLAQDIIYHHHRRGNFFSSHQPLPAGSALGVDGLVSTR
jgi:hypothetical protein